MLACRPLPYLSYITNWPACTFRTRRHFEFIAQRWILAAFKSTLRVYLTAERCCFRAPEPCPLSFTHFLLGSGLPSQHTTKRSFNHALPCYSPPRAPLSVPALAAGDTKLLTRDAYLAGFQSGYQAQPPPQSLESMHGGTLEKRSPFGGSTLETFQGGFRGGHGISDRIYPWFSRKSARAKEYFRGGQFVPPKSAAEKKEEYFKSARAKELFRDG